MVKRDLGKDWALDFPGCPTLQTAVPTSAYAALLEKGFIKDPYKGLNEYEIRELSRLDAIFSRRFTIDKAELAAETLELRFGCIDTIAAVYVNGICVGNADNMFCEHRYNIKQAALLGENLLEVRIASPVEYMEKKQNAYRTWQHPPELTMDGYGHIRKAHCMFGWDWGPQLPDMGIYRRVELVAYDGPVLENIQVLQNHRPDGSVVLTINGEFSDGGVHGLTVVLVDPKGKPVASANAPGGSCEIKVENPQLWWPNGYGGQPLYHVRATTAAGQLLEQRIGLRTIWVSTDKDKWGSEFCFVVNGHKIFAMGADYIPEDSLVPRTSAARSRRLLQACVQANFNCVRVWGGGYYPDDDFYDACDELGLLVWQDFMFACAVYNATPAFEACAEKEIVYNLKRLRNHACVALFCGNNEMEFGWMIWNVPQNEKLRQDYTNFNERLLPRLTEQYAPQTFYWPSSPSSGGGFDDPNSDDRGDVHYWDVWHGSKPFEDYRNHYFRFCSEFGFEAFPDIKTLQTVAEPGDMTPFSRVMESHQKCVDGNKKLLTYIADYYAYPKSFEMLVYASQLLQAEAIRAGVEHFRRFRGRCMGAIYWQLNDIWPCPSWAGLDYFGRWKALHHAARRFYAPVLLSAHFDRAADTATLNLSNEKLEAFSGRVEMGICRNDFTPICEWEYPCEVPPLSSLDIACEGPLPLEAEVRYECFMYYRLYNAAGRLLTSESLLLVPAKHYAFEQPRFTATFKQDGQNIMLQLKSSCYAKSIRLAFGEFDVQLSDNYFDMIDLETKEILLTQAGEPLPDITTLRDSLEIVSAADIGV